ncbi:MAG: peptidogalycan biosysnthesis protein [Chitinophagales bacterium]|nr:peptidogalycan biosysnthesis protein [Chitinophagales bacterium]MCZ2393117.1 peptidogalycan biosysnthesis protein [Chitinophagales bacterium]
MVQNLSSISISIEIECCSHISELNQEVWNQLVGNLFYARTSYLEIIEELNQEQMQFFYLLIKNNGNYCAAIYFQKLPFLVKNGLNNLKERNKKQCNWVSPFLGFAKNVKLPLLKSGNIFFTEDRGVYFANNIPSEMKMLILNQVSDYIYTQCKEGHSISIMWSNLSSQDGQHLQAMNGFQSLYTEPNMILDLHPSWKCFDDYLSDFSSKYRIRAKKVLSQSKNLVIQQLNIDEIIEAESLLMDLYTNVANNASFNLAYLSKGYFVRMKQLYEDDFVVKVYWLDNKMIGFTSSLYMDNQHYVHFIGLDYDANLHVPVYHRMLFEYVRDSIDWGHKRIYLGRTATEIKTTIGAIAIEMNNYLKISNVWYLTWLPSMLDSFGSKPYIERRPFKTAR